MSNPTLPCNAEVACQLPVRKLNRKRGMSALFTVLVFLAVFAIFTSAVGNLAIQRMRSSSRAVLQQRATYACEAGFVLATEFLEKQITYANAANQLTFGPLNTAAFNAAHTKMPLTSDPDVKVTVRIISNLMGPANITGPDGVNIDPGQVYITTLGQVGDGLAPASSRHLGGLATLGTQNYPYAIQCEGPITLNNTRISTFTSFDVTDPNTPLPMFWEYHTIRARLVFTWRGPRVRITRTTKPNALAGGGVGDGTNVFDTTIAGESIFPEKARLASNARVNAINVTNSRIDGTLSYGPGGSASSVSITPSTLNWSAKPTAPAPTPLPAPLYISKYKPPVDPTSVSAIHSGGSLTLGPGRYYRDITMNGGTLTLNCSQGGTNDFYVSRNMVLNNVNVVLSGLVNKDTRAKFYVGSKLTLNKCAVNRECGSFYPQVTECKSWPFNLSFLGCGGGGNASSPSGQTMVNITNSSDVWALFAGSSMNVTVANSQIGGAMKCAAVNMTSSTMFYDVGVNGNAAGYDVSQTLWGRVAWTMTGVTDYGPSLYQLAQSGLGAAGAIAPQGPGAASASLSGATSVANLGSNGSNAGPSVAGPGVGPGSNVGTGAVAATASAAISASSASFWASLFLGQ
jgi:hypothetical protein